MSLTLLTDLCYSGYNFHRIEISSWHQPRNHQLLVGSQHRPQHHVFLSRSTYSQRSPRIHLSIARLSRLMHEHAILVHTVPDPCNPRRGSRPFGILGLKRLIPPPHYTRHPHPWSPAASGTVALHAVFRCRPYPPLNSTSSRLPCRLRRSRRSTRYQACRIYTPFCRG